MKENFIKFISWLIGYTPQKVYFDTEKPFEIKERFEPVRLRAEHTIDFKEYENLKFNFGDELDSMLEKQVFENLVKQMESSKLVKIDKWEDYKSGLITFKTNIFIYKNIKEDGLN